MPNELVETVEKMVRRFVEARLDELVPALESGDLPLWPVARELGDSLGMPMMAEMLVEGLESKSNERSSDAPANASPAVLVGMIKELSRSCPGFALSLGASIGLCAQTILRKGTPEQRRRWALPVLSLEKVGAWALTEPGAGSDAFALRTTAKRVDGGWELDGEKTFITNAPDADVVVVYAKVVDTGRIHGFIVESSDAGVLLSKPFDKMGMRSSPTGSVALQSVLVGPERLLGGDEAKGGRRAVLETLLGERLALAAMALGIAEKSLEVSLAYAKDRQQFGQPIASFQAVQMRLARMYAAQETIRSLLERGIRQSEANQPDFAFLCAAKYTASTLATETALDAIQVLGGNGYMTEYRVEMFARDAKLLEIGGGTSDIQLLAIAKQLLA